MSSAVETATIKGGMKTNGYGFNESSNIASHGKNWVTIPGISVQDNLKVNKNNYLTKAEAKNLEYKNMSALGLDPGDRAMMDKRTGEKMFESKAEKMAAKFADKVRKGGFKINKDDANEATSAINSVYESNAYAANTGDPGNTNGPDGPGAETTTGSSGSSKGKYDGLGILGAIIQIFSDAFSKIF